MPIIHAIILGIVQGLSEFLPISSSGHLNLVPWLFGWDELAGDPELGRTFDVALHVGTFAGALAYFRSDVARLASAAFGTVRDRSLVDRNRSVVDPDRRLAWLLLVASMPAAVVGVLVDTFVDELPGGIVMIGVMLVLFGLVLAAADRLPAARTTEEFRIRDALLMGTAQALALQPGVSRSGATISMGRWLGFDRIAATRISFLMSLPIIGGAGLFEGVQVAIGEGLPPGFAAAFIAGMTSAAVTGFLAVWGLLRLVRAATFMPFVVYRVVLGVAVIALALAR